MKTNFLKSRVIKHGALATALTIGFVVVVVVINAIAGILLDRYPLVIDLTEDNRFTLTEESANYVAGIDMPVTITVCRSETSFENYVAETTEQNAYTAMFKQAYEILKDYEQKSDNVTLNFIDLNQNPTFADAYPSETLTSANIIVESELRYKIVQMSNLFSATQYSEDYVSYKSKAEQTMTSAIMYVLDNDPVTVIALNKTSETLSDYVNLLSANAFNVIEQNLLTDELDTEADVIILAGQTTDFSEEELNKLDKWLDNNGDFQKTMIYVPAMNMGSTPNFDEFLSEWGMQVEPGYLAETNSKNVLSGNAYMTIASIEDTDYAENLNVDSQLFLSPYTHAVNTLWESSQNRTTQPLITSSASSVIVPAGADESININVLEQDVHNVAVWGYRSKYVANELVTSNLIVFGSETALNGSALGHASLNNSNFGLAMVTESVGKDDEISVISIDFTSTTIAVTQNQITTVLIVFVIAIPVVILGLAIFTFFRRRHL